MMKKISFGKLKQRLHKRSKNKSKQSEEKQLNGIKDDKECQPECDGVGNGVDVNYDRLWSKSQSNQRIDWKSGCEKSEPSVKFPIEVFRSFRNRFRRTHSNNNNTEKVISTPKVSQQKDCNTESDDIKKVSLVVVNNEFVVNNNENQSNLRSHESNDKLNDNCNQLIESKAKLHLSLDESMASMASMSCSAKPTDDKSEPLISGQSVDTMNESLNEGKCSLIEEMDRLCLYGWYWGPITRKEAEDKLYNEKDGSFLVRDSSDDRYLFSLSFRSYGRTLHTRIEYMNGLFSFYSNSASEGHSSIVELIEESMSDSEKGVFCYSRGRSPVCPSFPVRLTVPVSRFTEVRSLQYLCKFIIRQTTNYSQIESLPLPNSIKGFIQSGRY